MSLKKLAKIMKLNIFKEEIKPENNEVKKIDTKQLSPIMDEYYKQIYNSPDMLGFRTLNISLGTKKKQK